MVYSGKHYKGTHMGSEFPNRRWAAGNTVTTGRGNKNNFMDVSLVQNEKYRCTVLSLPVG
jgi:hypothetical protein